MVLESIKSCLRRLCVYFIRSFILSLLTIFMVLAPFNILFLNIYISFFFYLKIFTIMLFTTYGLTILFHLGHLFKPINKKNIRKVSKQRLKRARKYKKEKKIA